MGEAKRRGNKETRTLQGIEKAKLKADNDGKERERALIQFEPSLTPEQKAAYNVNFWSNDVLMLNR